MKLQDACNALTDAIATGQHSTDYVRDRVALAVVLGLARRDGLDRDDELAALERERAAIERMNRVIRGRRR